MLFPDKQKSKVEGSAQKATDEITRKVAIVVAFLSVFVFFIKLLFF